MQSLERVIGNRSEAKYEVNEFGPIKINSETKPRKIQNKDVILKD